MNDSSKPAFQAVSAETYREILGKFDRSFHLYRRYDPHKLRRVIFGMLKRHPAQMKRLVDVAWR